MSNAAWCSLAHFQHEMPQHASKLPPLRDAMSETKYRRRVTAAAIDVPVPFETHVHQPAVYVGRLP